MDVDGKDEKDEKEECVSGWDVLQTYFASNPTSQLIRHQIESYDHFVQYQMDATVEMFNPSVVRHVVEGEYAVEVRLVYGKVGVYRPKHFELSGAPAPMFPADALLRNFNYSSPISCDVDVTFTVTRFTGGKGEVGEPEVTHRRLSQVQIGMLPVMVRSAICRLTQTPHLGADAQRECRFDGGGYFVIEGSEKTIQGQERLAENRIYCYDDREKNTKYTWRAEIRSVPPNKSVSPKQILMYMQARHNGHGYPVTVLIPRLKHPIPLFIFFRAIGVVSDREICAHIATKDADNVLLACAMEANRVTTQEEAIAYIVAVVREEGKKIGGIVGYVSTYKGTPSSYTVTDKNVMRKKSALSVVKHAAGAAAPLPRRARPGGKKTQRRRGAAHQGEGDDDDDDDDDDDVAMEDVIIPDEEGEGEGDADAIEAALAGTRQGEGEEGGEGGEEGEGEGGKDKEARAEAAEAKQLAYHRKTILSILSTDLFPHCTTLVQKQYMLGYMASRIIEAFAGKVDPHDRDSYVNKRVDTAGTLQNNLFRNHVNRMMKDAEKMILKMLKTNEWLTCRGGVGQLINSGNTVKIFKSSMVENGLRCALSSGDFSINKHGGVGSVNKVGVAQVLSRMTATATLSHSRRISTPTDKNGKLVQPRKLHASSWGFMCPVETPEDSSVGLIKNLSIMAHITLPSSSEPVLCFLRQHAHVVMTPTQGITRVFVNGAWVAGTQRSVALFRELKHLKSTGVLSIYLSVVLDYARDEIRVCTDVGRPTRPVLRVRDGRVLLDVHAAPIAAALRDKTLRFADLLTAHRFPEAVIEYIDAEEQNAALIAFSREHVRSADAEMMPYTHCEIDLRSIFGVCACCIPFPEHNQSPRNAYQCAQMKQAIGIACTNAAQRMDRTAYELVYPQKPLIGTRVMDMLGLHQRPSGVNAIVCIASYTGFNQEDSLILNKGSIDRGMFGIHMTHTEKDEDRQNVNGCEVLRGKPDHAKTKGMRLGNYAKLNADGVVPVNTPIENRDVIIGKMTNIKANRNDPTKLIKYEDQSRVHHTHEPCFVDRNYVGRNGDGYNLTKVRLRVLRKPQIGDKFSSRAGQKGTTGQILPEEDMMYTQSGLRPDLILNPHAIPSRMTVGHLKETMLGSVLLQLGFLGDAYVPVSTDQIAAQLTQLGYSAYGNQTLYDGATGRALDCLVFIGPVHYQRLKHMVADKQHARAFGPMVNLTRQPTEGRSRNGGLRIGEMERDCLISHGIEANTRERMMTVSDNYAVPLCANCGTYAAYNDDANIHYCHNCENNKDFGCVRVPYCSKLLVQELAGLGVSVQQIIDA